LSQASHKRSIVKAVIYRSASVLIVGGISYFVTGSFYSTSKIAVTFLVIETFFYYGYERLWGRITWEKKGAIEKQEEESKGREVTSNALS
jgi:uncharacterized membrane protein